MVNRAIELQKQDATTTVPDISPPSRTASQLRVQAQGALLSLAPHNIRYHELVAEGINPAILKQLYEEVGIRVSTPQPAKPAPVAPAEKVAKLEPSVQPKGKKQATPLDESNVPQHPAPRTASSDAGKPMERKELIAKMLAAKAAKASQPTTPKDVSEQSQPAAAAPSPSITPSNEKASENGTPVREKNKAQTELARQRIEALKKQALLKSQQRAQQLSQSSQEDRPLTPSDHAAPAVHHPLPVRPPAPQPSETAGLPGLSLTEPTPDVELQAPTGGPAGIAVDSTPLARANQRKRPRESDFDDAGATQKKYFQAAAPYTSPDSDKLIIHISDDESLYGDDEGEDMDVDSSPDQDSAPVTISTPLEIPRPLLQRSFPGTRTSTSTPQGSIRHGDQEQMRQKNLEIQALHRKIAEMEERRKAKLAASRTQSPRIVEDSAASSSAPASAAASTDRAETPPAPPHTDVKEADEASITPRPPLAVRPNEIDSFNPSSVRVLALMDSVQLDTIRRKILRIKEIEQDLPDLDAETVSLDSQLISCKEEADKLLSAVADEKDGRLQLIDELKNLSCEISGLTMADMDELRRQAQLKMQHLAPLEGTFPTRSYFYPSLNLWIAHITNTCPAVSAVTPPAAGAEDVAIPDADVPAIHSSESDFYADEPTNIDTVNGSHEAPAPSQPDATTSVLDESEDHFSSDDSGSSDSISSDSSSDESGSDEDSPSEEELDDSEAESIAQSAQMADDDQMQIDTLGHPLPDRPLHPPVEGAEDEAEEYEPTDHNGQEGDLSDAESSPESEAYEPPEPDTDADSSHSTYSPPPPAPLEDAADGEPLLDVPPIEEPLTEAPRVSFLEARPVYQGSDADILGV